VFVATMPARANITEMLVSRAFPPEMMTNAMDHFVDIFLHGILVKEAE
jgi:hypothetical protein